METITLDHCYYCYIANLFTPDPHNESCCIEAIVIVPRILYKNNCWFPLSNVFSNATNFQDVQYTLDGENYIKWYPTIKET